MSEVVRVRRCEEAVRVRQNEVGEEQEKTIIINGRTGVRTMREWSTSDQLRTSSPS